MRLYSTALLIAALVPLAAQAQPVKQTEVINFPAVQDVTGAVEVTNDAANPVEVVGEVEVTNLPASSGAERFQLVGFTALTYTGAMGGNFGVTEKCQIEFADSRMCSQDEVIQTTSIPSSLIGEAWVGGAVVNSSNNCNQWNYVFDSFDFGTTVEADGTVVFSAVCSETRPIACCAPVP